MFNRAQEELSKRKARSPQSQKTAITASGKYSKYALTDVLICAECGSRYKRVTWTSLGQKRIVWRCVNRLDSGKKYCQHSPTLSEPALQEAIVRALNKFNDEDIEIYQLPIGTKRHRILILPDVVFKIVVVFRLIEVANIDADTIVTPGTRLFVPDGF